MTNSIREILRKLRNGEKVTEDELLQKVSNGDTIFNYAITKGRSINCDSFSKTKSLDIILTRKRYDLLKNINLKTLLKTNRKNLNQTYIETILDLFLEGYDINISCVNPFADGNDLDDVADLYIIYVSYGLEDYLPMLDEKLMLLNELEPKNKDGKEEKKEENKLLTFFFGHSIKPTLLERILSKSNASVVDCLIDDRVKNNFDVAMIIRSFNIYQGKVDYALKPNNFIESFIERMHQEHEKIILTTEEELLLKRLRDAYAKTSDERAVRVLVNSFRVQLAKKNPNTIKEIATLIKMAKGPRGLKLNMGESQYCINKNEITIDKEITDIMNHEIAHAMYHNLTDGSVPRDFWAIMDRVRRNPDTLRKVANYSEKERENYYKIQDFAAKRYDETFPMMNKVIEVYKIRNSLQRLYDYELDLKRIELEKETYDLRKEISEYLAVSREEKMKIYKAKGYSDETLKALFKDAFTIKEYARMHKRIQKREYVDALSSSAFSPTRSIGDIIDGIYQGQFLAGKLEYNGKEILPVSGHGLFYYNYIKSNIFDEMLAGYRTIIMSENSEKYLQELRYYVGDELVDYLEYYYNNVMLREEEKSYGRKYA